MKSLTLFFFILSSALGHSQQAVLLFSDTIQPGDIDLDLTTGGVGTMTGSNHWVINSSYTGGSGIPATTPEDSVVSGTITHAPFSCYLHIYDSVGALSTGVTDCDWNPADASDHFAFLSNGICALGMDSVTFSFFWIAGGDSSAYGELYYRANGGAWTRTGRPKYMGQKDWLYEQVTDPAFSNVQNLQFGFRWVNPSGVVTPDMSFGVDDIIAWGTYDSLANPVHMTVTSITPDTVCAGQYLFFDYALSAPLCDGQYEVTLLNAAYQNVTGINIATFSMSAGDTIGSEVIQVPSGLLGNCFHIVLRRSSPAPFITSDTSICFSIAHCPVSIFTESAPVMTDPDTACIGSAIDVYFTSSGVFNYNNTYTAQLSDEYGSFASPYLIGSLPSGYDYSFPPGDITGMIPAVPPGCDYRIRVISSSPGVIGSIIGPFCLKECDERTNSSSDLHYCIGYPNQADTQTLMIKINEWNSNTTYDTCNNFSVQLLDMLSFTPVNTGGLGVFHVNRSDTFQLIVGPPDTLTARGIAAGEYYMRMLSSCSSSPTDTAGSVIRLTIGEPNPDAETLQAYPDTICFNVASDLYLAPFNPQSSYEWFSATFNNGLPAAIPGGFNGFGVIFPFGPAGYYTFQVLETNFGCPGPWSRADSLLVLSGPPTEISRPDTICLGDTAVINTNFLPATFWVWTFPPGAQSVAPGNNEQKMVFDSAGAYILPFVATNQCGSSSGSDTIIVNSGVTFRQSDTVWNILTMHPPALTGGLPPGGHYSGPFVAGDSLVNVSLGNNRDSAFTVTYTYLNGSGCNTSASLVFIATQITGISEVTSASIRLYPNPNTGSFTLETSSRQGSTYTVSNLLGQTIQQQPITEDRQTIEMGVAPAGIYTLSISGVEGMVKFAIVW